MKSEYRQGPYIGVIGAARIDAQGEMLAEELGYAIARRGGIVICGGLGGIMTAVCRGAHRGHGLTIGILPGDDPDQANPYVDIPIVTGLSHARNIIIVRTAQLVIAVRGEYGTLSEIALALKLGRPVLTLESWKLDAPLIRVDSPSEAVDRAWQILGLKEEGPTS
ncbi:TIGR00725 family protein [bacterium]|nr:TIGR00725 family protein [bacterium]